MSHNFPFQCGFGIVAIVKALFPLGLNGRVARAGILLIGSLLMLLSPQSEANSLATGGQVCSPLLQSKDVILLSSTKLARTAEFDTLLGFYQQALTDSEGLSSRYVEVDSAACQIAFGTRVTNLSDWRDVQRVIARIRQRTGARYFLIFGGQFVIPRPTIPLRPIANNTNYFENVESDGWYLDFDGDRIVDEGVSIGRFADKGVSYGNDITFPCIDSLLAALRTAVVLHMKGGVTQDNPISFTTGEYETPPFGVDPKCTQQALFNELLSTADMMTLWGHGEPDYFKNDTGLLMLDPAHLAPALMQQNHPLIFAWGPCDSGRLTYSSQPNPTPITPIGFPRDFQLAGAAAFIGRTTPWGFYSSTKDIFFKEFETGARLGDALFKAIRDSTLAALALEGESGLIAAQHFCLYGDPTLRLTPSLPCNAHRPVFPALQPGTSTHIIRVNGQEPNPSGVFAAFINTKLAIQVRPMQVGGMQFIQKSIRGMTCTLLISKTADFSGTVNRMNGVFKPGLYPRYDQLVFSIPPVQMPGKYYFRVQASNALGASQIPVNNRYTPYDVYTLNISP